jgi:hypothetical protein
LVSPLLFLVEISAAFTGNCSIVPSPSANTGKTPTLCRDFRSTNRETAQIYNFDFILHSLYTLEVPEKLQPTGIALAVVVENLSGKWKKRQPCHYFLLVLLINTNGPTERLYPEITARLTLWRRNFLLNFRTTCIQNVNNTGTKKGSIMK